MKLTSDLKKYVTESKDYNFGKKANGSHHHTARCVIHRNPVKIVCTSKKKMLLANVSRNFRPFHKTKSRGAYSKRFYSSKTTNKETDVVPCPNTTCKKKETKSVVTSLKTVLGLGPPKPIPPKECCRVKQAECKPDPDLSEFGGTAYRTCGSAYVVQKDNLPFEIHKISKEDKILQQIEANIGTKHNANDPMPSFTSVEQRMMDLDARRLHPHYKCYQNVPKRRFEALPRQKFYKTRSGPIGLDDVPVQLKYNRDLLEKKNMYSEYKRVEPPQQLLGKVVEMSKNERPALKKRVPVLPADAKASTKKTVYDTLYQKEIKF